MRIEMIWDKWVIYDEDGFVCGIRSDAPEEAKVAYKEYLARTEATENGGIISK